jgi:sulfur carrier protein ThiS
VHLHTTLRRRGPGGVVRQLETELPEGGTLADLLASLELKPEAGAVLLVVNGATADPSLRLRAGDEVHLIPALSGG